jgi:hypothetical protein
VIHQRLNYRGAMEILPKYCPSDICNVFVASEEDDCLCLQVDKSLSYVEPLDSSPDLVVVRPAPSHMEAAISIIVLSETTRHLSYIFCCHHVHDVCYHHAHDVCAQHFVSRFFPSNQSIAQIASFGQSCKAPTLRAPPPNTPSPTLPTRVITQMCICQMIYQPDAAHVQPSKPAYLLLVESLGYAEPFLDSRPYRIAVISRHHHMEAVMNTIQFQVRQCWVGKIDSLRSELSTLSLGWSAHTQTDEVHCVRPPFFL